MSRSTDVDSGLSHNDHNGSTHTRKLGALLSGWAGIEHHMVKHDTVMVKDYADDIDTLLVFAGLFSAVLTAFVVETYTLLQPDNMAGTNQLLAHGFSSQLSPSAISPTFNATLSSVLTPLPFTPSLSARWINSLFFVSLVLSLAAAFFGILAKQWLREYMQWNSPLAAPRQNVLIRQARFEAWEAWNMAATISAVPAFLELAMILYLIGITILVWTLDDVVAVVVTVFVAAFLGAASAFTILPLLCKRCPYKSPTAWALCAAWDAACTAHSYSRNLWMAYTRHSHLVALSTWWRFRLALQSVHWPARRRNWRERDIDACKIGDLGRCSEGSKDVRNVARLELVREEGHLLADDTLIWPHFPSYPDIHMATRHISRNAADIFLTDLSETALLWRALSWLRKTSQDVRVSKYIDECIGSIHYNSDAFGVYYAAHSLTNWCIVSSLVSGRILEPQAALLRNKRHDNLDGLTHVRRALHIEARHGTEWSSSRAKHFVFSVNNRPGRMRLLGPIKSGPELYILLRILSADLRQYMDHLQAMIDNQEATVRPDGFGSHVRRVFELTSALTRLASYAESPFLGGSQYTAGLYAIISSQGRLKEELETQAPGLRLVAFRLACRYAKVSAHAVDGENILAISDGNMDYSEYESLLLGYFDHDFRQCSDDDLNIFIATTISWLSIMGADTRIVDSEPSEAITMVLKKIADATAAITERRGRRHCQGCLTDDSDWLEALSYDFRWRHGNLWSLYPTSARLIFHHFEALYAQGLLTGNKDDTATNLHICLHRLHRDMEACETEGCRWISHNCEDCPIPIADRCSSSACTDTSESVANLSLSAPSPTENVTFSEVGKTSRICSTWTGMEKFVVTRGSVGDNSPV